MNITIQYHERQIGPYTLEEVNRRLRDGKIKPDALAWQEGTEGWVPLKTIPGVSVKPGLSRFLGRYCWKLWAVIAAVGLWINHMQEQDIRDRLKHENEMRRIDNMGRESYSERQMRLQAEAIAEALKR